MARVEEGASKRAVTEWEWPSAEISDCPYPFYEALRTEVPVYNYPAGSDRYLVSRWEDIVYVMEHPEMFVNDLRQSPMFDGFFAHNIPRFAEIGPVKYEPLPPVFSDGVDHRVKRRWGLAIVERKRMKSHEARLRAIADELIDGFIESRECEFRGDYAVPLPGYLICDVMGLPRKDFPRLIHWVDDSVRGFAGLSEEEAKRRDEANRGLNEYVYSAVMERYQSPTDDYLSELIAMQVESDGEIDINFQVSQGANLIVAAAETTPHMLVNTLLLLLEHPEGMERVRQDRSLIRGAVEESMRLETPFQWFCRFCAVDAVVGGVEIPAGSTIIIVLASGNRDPEKFDQPEKFNIDRANVAKDHLAFGRGAHLCVGAPLVRLEGEVAFDHLLSRLQNIRLVPADSDLDNLPMKAMRAPARLRVAFDPI